MKRILALLLALLMIPLSGFADEFNISVVFDGQALTFDVPPMIINDRTMVPFRTIFESFDAEVEWLEETREVLAKKGNTEIKLQIENTVAFVGEDEKTLDSPPVIIEGRTLVPLRFIGEALGCEVKWDGESRTVTINSAMEELEEGAYNVASVTANKDDGNRPQYTLDGLFTSRWSAEGTDCWILYELEDVKPIGYIGVAFYMGGERQCNFDILVSEDGENFTEVLKVDKSEMTLDMVPYDMGGVKAKYVKLACHGNSANAWNSITEVKIYAPRKDGEMPTEKTNQVTRSVEDLPDDLREVLTELCLLIDKEALEFLIDMYDPESGGFWSSVSAREAGIFEPLVEKSVKGFSTAEYAGVRRDGIPKPVEEKMNEFILSRQSEEDGYWYDPGTGSAGIHETRRQRYFAQATGWLTAHGLEPLYPTPMERIRAEQAEAAANGEDKAPLEDEDEEEEGGATEQQAEYLQSEEAFRKWLWELDTANTPYESLSLISAFQHIADALGYTDIILEYLIETQNPETGVWGDTLTSDSINGALKIAGYFNQSTVPYPYPDKMIESVVEICSLVRPDGSSETWNRLGLLERAIKSYKEFDPELRARIDKALVGMLELTLEDCRRLRRDDGGYSASQSVSPSTYYDVSIALGVPEGDIEGTCCMGSIMYSALSVAGVSRFADNSELSDWFWGELLKKYNDYYGIE